MTENNRTSHTDEQTGSQAEVPVEPTLRGLLEQPKGVLQKNLKTFIYLGAALLVIVAALFSSSGKKTPAQQAAAKGQAPQPTLQDNTDNNVQDLKNQLQAERQKEQQAANFAAAAQDPSLASATLAQQAAAAAFGPTGVSVPSASTASCVPGRSCAQGQQSTMQPQLTPEQQQTQLIAAKERERIDNSRFASNLVYSSLEKQQQQQPQQQGQMTPVQYEHTERQAKTSLVTPRAEGEQEETPGGYSRPLQANIDRPLVSPISSTKVRFSTRF